MLFHPNKRRELCWNCETSSPNCGKYRHRQNLRLVPSARPMSYCVITSILSIPNTLKNSGIKMDHSRLLKITIPWDKIYSTAINPNSQSEYQSILGTFDDTFVM